MISLRLTLELLIVNTLIFTLFENLTFFLPLTLIVGPIDTKYILFFHLKPTISLSAQKYHQITFSLNSPNNIYNKIKPYISSPRHI